MEFNFSVLLSLYDVTGELMMLALSGIILLIMFATKPQSSKMYRTCFAGTFLSSVTILSHLFLLLLTCSILPYNKKLYVITYIVYSALYIILLAIIYSYIALLSHKARIQKKRLIFTILVSSAFYFVLTLNSLYRNRFFIDDIVQTLRFTKTSYVHEICGIICAIMVTFTTLKNRDSVSKVVFAGITIFVPLEIAILFLHFFFKNSFFICFSYVIPFLIIFILFHSAVYDDIIGCQNISAINTRIAKAIAKKKNYMIINVYIPQVTKRDFFGETMAVQNIISIKCRKIERLLCNSRIYTKNLYTYSLFTTYKNKNQIVEIAEKIRGIIAEPFMFDDKSYSIACKQIITTNNENITSENLAESLISYLELRLNNDMETECIIANEDDYKEFALYHKVEQAVLDLRVKKNINDERIICYIQPIHCVKTKTFRTGEALLRFKLNDELIPPYLVVAAAESNNCIHPITLIMLNKICKKIKELEEQNYDFDAITVNCSTMELADVNFHEELLSIVRNSGIQPNHLRVEITESTTITNYDNILFNMKKINEAGIQFYLDDFGTGYSNLERISAYPFKTIKFDKSILYNAIKEKSADKLVRMLVNYFHNNNFHTVVEGVEDESQYEYCKNVGFEYVQGYLFSKPIPYDMITNYFQKK